MPRIAKKIEDEPMITYSVLDRPSTESDFVNNPDLLVEFLPQPYRRIDKVLTGILDEVWSIVEKNEYERTVEMNKPRPDVYSNVSVLEVGQKSFV